MKDTLPQRSLAQVLRRAGLAEAADRAGRAGPEDAARACTRRSARTSTCSISRRRNTGSRTGKRTKTWSRSSRTGTSRRASSSCTHRAIRRRSSCGRSTATRSITAPCTSPRSPTTRATSTSRSAGASAGTQGPFEIWQAAGWHALAKWIAEDIAAGQGMTGTPLPALGDGNGSHRRARRAGLVCARSEGLQAAFHAAGLPPPAVSRPPAGRTGQVRRDHVRERWCALLAHRRRHRDRQLQEPHACHRRRRARRRSAGAGGGRAQLHGPRHLADRAAVLGRRESQEDAGRRREAVEAVGARQAVPASQA